MLKADLVFAGKLPQECVTLDMASTQVNINFEVLALAFQKYIREKAKQAGSTIIYKKGDLLIEENPTTFETRIIKRYK